MGFACDIPPNPLASPDKETIRDFFEGIAFRYDQINSLLSFSLDENWRKRAARLILQNGRKPQTILDLGVGTGKFLRRFLQLQPWQEAVGADFAGQMLRRARTALPSCRFIQTDIHDLPFETSSFDLIVSAFTLRSVKDRKHFFAEVHRVLAPKGTAGFLCLTRPTSVWGRIAYVPYLKFYLPLMGGFIAKNPAAYQFLSQSIQAFPPFQEIGKELLAGGFESFSVTPFTFGISTLLVVQK